MFQLSMRYFLMLYKCTYHHSMWLDDNNASHNIFLRITEIFAFSDPGVRRFPDDAREETVNRPNEEENYIAGQCTWASFRNNFKHRLCVARGLRPLPLLPRDLRGIPLLVSSRNPEYRQTFVDSLLTRRQIAHFIFTLRHTRIRIGRFYKRGARSLNAPGINKRLKIRCI